MATIQKIIENDKKINASISGIRPIQYIFSSGFGNFGYRNNDVNIFSNFTGFIYYIYDEGIY